ncbi:hypothetical protein QOZ80_5BG0418580 [Eleusine coracana subsp. coracana]|nr:hypothetical protein QOZ80_5BG0418580 [Eleusine coracana subsp. coracana]
MASSITAALAIVLLALTIAVQTCRGAELVCEALPPHACAFAVSATGKRCVLERTPEGLAQCQTSPLRVRGRLSGSAWVETDACVRACGVDRAALGLPAVAGEDRRLVRALCSPACRDGCPNIVDLYATLAAGEGVSLPALCDAAQIMENADAVVSSGYRRMMLGGGGMSPLGAPVAAPVAMAPMAAAAAPM